MTERIEPQVTEIVTITAEVELALGRIEALDEERAQNLDGLQQDPAEIGYYEAELRSLESALPGDLSD